MATRTPFVRANGLWVPLAAADTLHVPILKVGPGWIDLPATNNIPAGGVTLPDLTVWSSPHGNLKSPRFVQDVDEVWQSYHIPHGVDPSGGVYLHAHFIVDGTSTNTVKWEWEYSYAHGYERQVFSTPATVSVTYTPPGVAKTHLIAEIASPILASSIETDGIIYTRCRRTTNGGTDNPNNVLVVCFDAHAKLLGVCSENRNYPFGAPT